MLAVAVALCCCVDAGVVVCSVFLCVLLLLLLLLLCADLRGGVYSAPATFVDPDLATPALIFAAKVLSFSSPGFALVSTHTTTHNWKGQGQGQGQEQGQGQGEIHVTVRCCPLV